MTCDRLRMKLDDFVDGALADADLASLRAHSASCASCSAALERERELRGRLRSYRDASMPAPAPGFYERALERAIRDGHKRQQRRSWLAGFGSAIAAGIAIWFVSSILIGNAPPVAPETSLPTIAMTVTEPRTINLVFSSARRLPEATLTVLLPDGMRIAGFDGQRITWKTSLKEGKNILPLQLVADYPTSGELRATLRHDGDDRTFRLRIEVS